VLPGAFAQAVADADTFFRIEFPALEQWSFTQAEARRITQPVLAVLGADSHTLWPGWVEGHHLVQAWFPPDGGLYAPRRDPRVAAHQPAGYGGRVSRLLRTPPTAGTPLSMHVTA
jgi:hypothetical protein